MNGFGNLTIVQKIVDAYTHGFVVVPRNKSLVELLSSLQMLEVEIDGLLLKKRLERILQPKSEDDFNVRRPEATRSPTRWFRVPRYSRASAAEA